MKKTYKSNAMRLLDDAHISYQVHTYEHQAGASLDGLHVAQQLKEDPSKVFKTILTQAPTKAFYVFVLPVPCELDLKKCAHLVNEKSLALIPVSDINKVSGYVRGGCSPLAMKKQFKTIFHESSISKDTIYFSGGKIGYQIEMQPEAVIALIGAELGDIVKK